ncbi:MAG: alanine racemase [Candidatus Eremiobacteraeota bacterium]|nr:alanine racemase [Candidatus Eremiobacteraeota bacterium]
MRPTLEVNLDAIRQNVQAWRGYLGGRPLWAVVKCDGYRLGMAQVARACLEASAERLCIVEMFEAALLRKAGIDAPIVQIAATPAGDLEAGVKLDVTMSIADAARALAISRYARQRGVTARVHVAIETGTGWWGVAPAEAAEFAREVAKLANIEWEGAWAHIAGRDSLESQVRRLHAGVEQLRANGVAVPTLHIGSTGPSVWGLVEGAARIGVGLYGSSMGDEQLRTKLRTAVEVRAPIYGIRRFAEPMPLGYGGTYVALPGQTIVTLRIGYGEGIPKSLAGRGSVLLGDVLCPIVGAIGMNFTMVAVPPNIDVSLDDEAVILADRPGVRLDEIAAAAQTIPHNLITMFGSGIAPVYSGAALTARTER